MRLYDILDGWFSHHPRSQTARLRRQKPIRGSLETLEARCLLTTFTVVNLNDSGPGSLRAAVSDANSTAGADEIVFSSALLKTSTRTIGLASGRLTITEQVSIVGPDGTPDGIIVSGTNSSRVFEVSPGASNVKFSFLTITQGDAGPSDGGGGLFNQGTNTVVDSVTFVGNSARDGGAISNTGAGLQIHRSLIASNTAVGFGGGGIFNSGTALINQSTITDNQLTGMGGGGGGVATSGSTQQLQINASNIARNTAGTAVGGGVFNFSTNASAISITNSTVTGNLALGGGGVQTNGGTVHLTNLTIVGNVELQDLSGTAGGLGRLGVAVNATNLIISRNFSPGADDDVHATSINGVNNNNFIGGEPRLGPLQDNGGPTFTMLPLPGSPVIDNGTAAGSTLLDQRGFERSVSEVGNTSRLVDQGAVEYVPTLTQPYVVGPGANQADTATLAFSATGPAGVPRFANQDYPGFPGEVRVALGDFNADGIKDIVTAPGPGGGPHIRIRNGVNPNAILTEFFAYNAFFGGGVYVATGDIDGDGVADLITGAGAGGGPHVRVFRGGTFAPILELFPFGSFSGGVRVASGDINNDGRADIIVAAGPGGGPHVKVYSGMTVLAAPNDNSLIGGNFGSFFAYTPGFAGGVFVASGDVNGDGIDDLITGAGDGGGPHVRVLTNSSATPIADFFAYTITFTGGVRVAAVDLDGDNFDDVVTGAGPGGGPHVRIVSGHLLSNGGASRDLASYFAYSPLFTGGVYVAGSHPGPAGGSPLLLDDAGHLPLAPKGRVTEAALAEITSAAIHRFAAIGLNSAGMTRLETVAVEFADLGGNLLGITLADRVLIDVDGAGFGFFVDPTPLDDLEFLAATGQAIHDDARERVDLLTVVMHELAHALGASDHTGELDHDDILSARLTPGLRRIVQEDDLADFPLTFPEKD